jgi:hypothetical protein
MAAMRDAVAQAAEAPKARGQEVFPGAPTFLKNSVPPVAVTVFVKTALTAGSGAIAT